MPLESQMLNSRYKLLAQIADGLETLADLFGKDELRAPAAEVRKQAGSEFV